MEPGVSSETARIPHEPEQKDTSSMKQPHNLQQKGESHPRASWPSWPPKSITQHTVHACP
eukprot:631344-Pelagomonas_calceolata.AAC.1